MAKKMILGCSILALALSILIVNSNCANTNTLSCIDSLFTLEPCKPFLAGNDEKPNDSCCLGLKSVQKEVTGKADIQALCECFKKYGPILKIKPEKAKQLPRFCCVSLTFPIGPGVDCNHVGFP